MASYNIACSPSAVTLMWRSLDSKLIYHIARMQGYKVAILPSSHAIVDLMLRILPIVVIVVCSGVVVVGRVYPEFSGVGFRCVRRGSCSQIVRGADWAWPAESSLARARRRATGGNRMETIHSYLTNYHHLSFDLVDSISVKLFNLFDSFRCVI